MKNKKIFIKFISALLLISLLIGMGGVVLFKPKPAHAGIPVIDWVQQVKEYVIDTLLRVMARTAARSMVSNISDWARSGFRGNQPFAVTSWENYLKRAVNIGSARFIQEFGLTELCLPFRDILGQRLGLGVLAMYQPIYQEYAFCTIERIAGNVQEFFDNPSISTYGWGAWTALAQPQNNIYGSLLLAAERRAELEDEAREAKKTEATISGGYQNFSECIETGTLGICIKEQLKTTGTEIHDTLEDAIGADLEWIISADEISELLGAFVTGLWNRLIGGFYSGEELPLPPVDEPVIPEIPEFPGWGDEDEDDEDNGIEP